MSWSFAARPAPLPPVPAADRTADAGRQSVRFLLLYALAVAGGAVAYVPFLTLLLPMRVSAMAGGEDIAVIAYAAFAGAIAASLANIAFGWASDRTRSRRPWIGAGLVLSSVLLCSVSLAEGIAELVALIVAWQVALNMLLGPLAAWAGDCVPDRQKGLLGGLLAFAPASGALSGAFVTWPGLAAADTRLLLLAGLVSVMVAPVLLFGRPRAMPHLALPPPRIAQEAARQDAAVARMWLARLLVQIAEAALFAFLLLWLRSIDPRISDSDAARVFSLVLGLSVPLALVAGRWSDRAARPLGPLVLSAGTGAAGLLIMASAEDVGAAVAGYLVFGLATGVFLALHASQTLRILPRPATRGRDLGLFNLTNTMPSLIMPWMTLALVPLFGFDALFLVLAVLSAAASVLVATIRRRA